MNAYNEASLTQLIRQTRNHLWKESLLHSINTSLWISATLVIITGIGHLFLAWPNMHQAGLVMALLPPLLAFLFCLLFQRPGMEAASRTADRWFNADSLLLSAWDLIQHPTPHSATGQLVIRRALKKTSTWQSQIKTHSAMVFPRSSALAATGMLIGATLLSLPGGTQQLQDQSNTQFASAKPIETANPLADIARSFSQPSKPIPDLNAATKNNNANAVTMDTMPRNSAGKKEESTSAPETEQQAHHPLPSTDRISAANQIDRDGGTPIGTPSHSSSQPHKADKQKHDIAGSTKAIEGIQQTYDKAGTLAVSTIQIKRRADADDSRYSTHHQGAPLADFNLPTQPSAAGRAVVAAEIGNTPLYPGHFNLSQQHLIAQYFQNLHSGAEK